MHELFQQLTHGVYVIAVSDGTTYNAFTAAWVMQVSFNPPLLAFSINPKNYSYTLLQKGGVCTVNVLAQQQLAIAKHFGQPKPDKMLGFHWRQGLSSAPILADSLAYFDCQVSHYTDAGDHKLVVCKVLAGAILHQGKPLLYGQTGDMDGSDALY
jgi:flavin reductase (DIM6/NTAB) family NADH-FMN oxidoreductase RutF